MNNTPEHKDYIPAEFEVICVDSTDIICSSPGGSIDLLDYDGEI